MNRKSILILFGFLLFAMVTYAQKTLRGKVTDVANGNGMPGVSVVAKGTSGAGASTQPDGTYTINVPTNATILVFTYLGFTTKEVSIGNSSEINVALSESAQTLEGIVVTALGIKRSEKSVGYATQQIKGDNLTLTKEQNVIGSLAGKVAGVQVTGSSGASMGGTQKIKIRSVNSITGGGQALMVVDGTPIAQSNFGGDANGVDYGNVSQDINPEDIENISILKGPAASALYGIRGQYGVILITTKKGAKGAKKVNIGINSAFSVEKVGNFLPLQNIYGVGNNQTFLTLTGGQKYVNGNDESWGPKMDGTPVRMYYSFYPQDAEFGKLTPFLPQPDNVKDFYETGQNVNNGISVTGGNENMNYRLSYNNAYINGVIPNTWLKRNNLGLSSSLNITEKLSVGANVNYANNDGQRPTQGYQGSFTGANQWFQRNIDINRLRNYRYADGTILNWNVNPNTTTGIITNNRPSDWNNPFFDAYEVLNNDSRDRLFGDVNATYQVLPELKLSGFVRSDMFIQNITHKEGLGGRLVDGYQVGKYQNTENNYEFLGQYSKNFNDFSVNVNVGANLYTVKYSQQFQATVGGLSSPGWYSAAASIDRPTSTSFLRQKQVRSVYAMGSFGYKDMFFLDASIRNDISSALPDNNNSYWYPSVSGSFVFSELAKWNALSFGKLRASYAIAGSDLSPYQTTFTYGAGANYPATAGAINTLLVPDKLKNPLIKPSFANSFEVGLDLKFFKNRLGMEFTYYNQQNKDQIIDLSVSGASGFDQTVVNAGLIENKGVELTLSGRPIQSKFFTWDATINFANNKNRIVDLYPGISILQNDVASYSSQNIFLYSTVKQSFGNLVGPGYRRDAATGKILLGADNMPLFDAAKDFGSVLPSFTGGLQNTFRIGRFDLGAMIDFQKGGQFFSWSKMLSTKSGQADITAAMNENGKNVRDPLADGGGVKVNGIYGPGTKINNVDVSGQEFNGFVDARTYYRANLGTRIYDEWIYSASYIKLREVSLGYNFDSKLLGKTPFKSAKLAIIARNPVMIWQKAPKGLDPSELSSGSAAISWIEKGEFQTVRSFGVNLSLTF
ncbi:SusC/RagA family TonB-linked outer membrane protein [Pedobacter sp. Hv1]|uniref:SusC/RagA family TonB-linked outer membrane protein n=1 Tax=Pedobacter sp. Hv1 TaxID=1740090 RepID=UPI0006D8928C|nr:SusC/RagA family TonB-linked outer membrane protein [Pedobacter sp. Hv1]KQC00630.1 SusC/RagA family TonB-linked outer membrane protein [Pedobacter sp. Hv1]